MELQDAEMIGTANGITYLRLQDRVYTSEGKRLKLPTNELNAAYIAGETLMVRGRVHLYGYDGKQWTPRLP